MFLILDFQKLVHDSYNRFYKIGLLRMFCPFCDKEHDISIMETHSECLIKNKKVDYIEKYYYCEECDVEFADGELIDQNLQNARDQFSIKYGLLEVNNEKNKICEFKKSNS